MTSSAFSKSTLLTPISVSEGGTGLSTLTNNSVLIGSGSNNVSFVAPGTSGNVLTSNGTVWQSAAASGSSSTGVSEYIVPSVQFAAQSSITVSSVINGTNLDVTVTGTWFLMWGDHFVSFSTATYQIPVYGFLYVDQDLTSETAGTVTVGAYTISRKNPSTNVARIVLAERNNDSLGYNIWGYQDGKFLDSSTKNIIDNSFTTDYVNYAIKTVKKDGTGDYITIPAAISAVSALASSLNRYEIQVYDDFYYDTVAPYTSNAILHSASYIKIKGMHGKRTVYSEIPTTGAYTQGDYSILHIEASTQNFELENIDLIIKNGKYAVHADSSGTELLIMRNCKFQHLGNSNSGDASIWSYLDAWGTGLYDNQRWYFYDCKFIGGRTGFACHQGSLTYNGKVSFNNCEFIISLINNNIGSLPYGAVLLRTLLSGQKDLFEFNNCTINGKLNIVPSINGLNKNYAEAAIPELSGTKNTPTFYTLTNTDVIGNVLQIYSAATGSGSYVIVNSGSALDYIYGGQHMFIGGGSLSGYNYGTVDITYSDLNPGTGATRWSQTLGHRLGDCSSTNKYLYVNLNGTIKTITFDQNYPGGNPTTSAPNVTNATIIASMSSALNGTGSVQSYNVINNYYPPFDILNSTNGSTTTSLMSGSFVRFNKLEQVTLSNQNEYADGILLDNLTPSSQSGWPDQYARVLTTGYLPITGRFAPQFESSQSISIGDKFIMSPTPGKIIKSTSGSFICEAIGSDTDIVLKFRNRDNNR